MLAWQIATAPIFLILAPRRRLTVTTVATDASSAPDRRTDAPRIRCFKRLSSERLGPSIRPVLRCVDPRRGRGLTVAGPG